MCGFSSRHHMARCLPAALLQFPCSLLSISDELHWASVIGGRSRCCTQAFCEPHALQTACSRERKKTQSLGKHTKKVVCGVWNRANQLAMAGLDRLVSQSVSRAGAERISKVQDGQNGAPRTRQQLSAHPPMDGCRLHAVHGPQHTTLHQPRHQPEHGLFWRVPAMIATCCTACSPGNHRCTCLPSALTGDHHRWAHW
jgi:hypothetical protein